MNLKNFYGEKIEFNFWMKEKECKYENVWISFFIFILFYFILFHFILFYFI